jgi:hypothetical protein
MSTLLQNIESAEQGKNTQQGVEDLDQGVSNAKELQPTGNNPEKESDTTTELIKMFAPMFLNKSPVSAPIPTENASISSPMEQKQHFTDEQIKAIWDNTPKIAKVFAKKSDEQTIKTQIIKQIPNIDEDSIARAIKLIAFELCTCSN